MEASRNIDAFVCNTFRDIIRKANEKNLKKKDIITISKYDNQFYLVYETDN